MNRVKLLLVCQWPLGGIRTYLKYHYQYFNPSEFEVTLLARPVAEQEALAKDMKSIGIDIIWAKAISGRYFLAKDVVSVCRRNKIQVIHSHGFQSALHVSLVNRIRHVPHMMVVHGIVEEKYFHSRLARLKKWILSRTLKDVDLAISVSDDIKHSVQADLPALARDSLRWKTIQCGIEARSFTKSFASEALQLRQQIQADQDTFLFGFFGRFMPQKGFNYLIDAIEILSRESMVPKRPAILAVGSGDYSRQTRELIKNRGLERYFHFLPFCPNIAHLIQGCDAVVMPSVWEAFGLLAAEVLCSGIPLIASNCLGLREAVANTPTLVFDSCNSVMLAEKMRYAMKNSEISGKFRDFRARAAERYDVQVAAEKLIVETRRILENSV